MKNLHSYILVAEDDEDDQFLLQEAFSECDTECTLHFVGDGTEVMTHLDACLQDPSCLPSLILLDLNMPKKDGRQTLIEIKQNKRLQNIPIVMVTTSKNIEDITFCKQAGADQYVVKPAQFSELVEHADTLLKRWMATHPERLQTVGRA